MPDLIETASNMGSSHADATKTHHNDSEMVRQFRIHDRLVEPLEDFHKDELRDLGPCRCHRDSVCKCRVTSLVVTFKVREE
uniref:Uncharacterized protein n=2 Tax=Daphnia magna TaxID=35525 RepID=A0A0P5SAG7_9CRUS